MRRSRYWFLGVLVFALLSVGGYAFYDHYLDRSYFTTSMYSDTGIERDPDNPNLYVFSARTGYIILEISRGERADGVITTAHGSMERIAIECPQPQVGTRIEVGPTTPVFLRAHLDQRVSWRFGDKAPRGHIDIEEVTERRITARYEIIVDGFSPQLIPNAQHKEIVFQGRDVFRRQPAPESKRFGDLWPRPSPTPTPK